jgi:hypothetical protein
VMVAFPYSSVVLISYLSCPIYASVFIARARICLVSVAGGVKLLACKFIVTVPIFDRSGSCSARALRSTGAKVGIVGGAIWTFAKVISSLQSISLSHCISSYCYSVISSLLLILIIVMVQLYQKRAHT